MKAHYLCPSCRCHINVNNDIVLIARACRGKRKGIVYLHAELGNFETKFTDDFLPVDGDQVAFSCPICHFDLSIKNNSKLARFAHIDQEGKESTIIFSQIFGEKCTYKVEDKKVTMSYGEHISKYTNPEWYIE